MDPVIMIKNLDKSYGSKHVLKNINLDIFPGQVIGYIGPNGAGKSTTVKILTGLIGDFTGTVTVNGINIKENPLAVKAMVGYVPELAELYDMLTPSEFLQFMAMLYDIPELIATDRILIMLRALDLEKNMHDRMDTFSKGMKQKVLLISGLLHNPDIIILDEPLSGLDANSVIIVKDLISKLAAQGKTIFYSSHIMDVVEKVSHRIVLINNGEIVANGTFEELKQMQGNHSLEQIFSGLTGTASMNQAAGDIMKAFE